MFLMIKSHFEDCPYSCNQNGKILDRQLKKLIDCPYCSKKKKELLAKGMAVEEESESVLPLADILGIKSKYLSRNYVFGSVIPEGEQMFLEPESIDYVKAETEDIYHQLSIGELPEDSYCIGVSIKGRVDRVAYPMLAIAYLKGLTVSKFITCAEFARLHLRGDDELDSYYSSDLVIMLIGEGSTKGEISCAKGLMQARALKGKPTIFLTTWTIEACSLMLGYSSDKDNLFLAKPVFVKYRTSKKQSNYINQLTGVDNSRYGSTGTSFSDL